jgi:hypothetical protein
MRDARVAERFAAEHGKQVLDIYRSPLLDSSASKTLFLLGSGWSVNELTDGMVRHISNHRSVGINFWFFHSFVPTAFSFDAGKVSPGEEGQLQASLNALGVLFGRPKIVDAKPRVLYLRPYQSNPSYLVPSPPELSGLCWVTGRANLLAGGPESIEADLRFLVTRAVSGTLPRGALPDNGSSVVRLIFFALAQGFRDIVLVGIDLDTRPHFWFAPPYTERYPEYVALFPDPDSKRHGTTESVDRALGNLEFLAIFSQVITELDVAKLWVSSPTSQLANVLPLYPWPTNGGQE